MGKANILCISPVLFLCRELKCTEPEGLFTAVIKVDRVKAEADRDLSSREDPKLLV